MEKFLKPYDKEYMRMAMLKHEETFKEQVYELHRLYQIQKTLMRNIGNKRPDLRSQELWNSKNGFSFNENNRAHDTQQKSIRNLDLERPAEEYAAELNVDRSGLELIDESEIELTLGPSSYGRRKKTQATRTSDSGPSFSSSSTGSSHMNRTNFLTHQITNTARDELCSRELGLLQVPEMTLEYQNGSKNGSDVDERLRQERLKQPPWLFQVLSLNMT